MDRRNLDSDTIRLLMERGQQLIYFGDIVSARLVFQRAAEAGDAAAAVAMGATYDPIMLAKSRFSGLPADVGKARSWYEKAKALGSTEASGRLKLLAKQ
jgi:TPR repeat protein